MPHDESLENPVLGYVVVTVALVVGILSASVFGGIPDSEPQSPAAVVPAVRAVEPCSGSAHSVLSRRWVLGVRSEATSSGCVVTSVIQGSAAERAGLSIGDRILNVDGRQVGWVRAERTPLHRQIDRSASGNVQLLVQRGRRGSVVVLPVRLNLAAETLGH